MSLRTRQFAVAFLAVLMLGTGLTQAADPFYTNLLRDGTGARARGDLEAAIEDLRIACFGLLDEPPLLAQCLVELALAQAGAGQSGEFERSIDRLLQVEEQFEGYSQAGLAVDARQQFEDLLYRRVDPARLDGIAAFAPLSERRKMDALAAAGPDQRRVILQERLASDPANAQWLRMLADLETAQRQPTAAVPHLSALLALTPSDALLQCERFRAATQAGLCEIALADLPFCPADAADIQTAELLLGCHIGQLHWQEAAAYLVTLPTNVRSTSKIRKLDRRVQKELRNLPAAADIMSPATESLAEGGAGATGTTEDRGIITSEAETETVPIAGTGLDLTQSDQNPCASFETAARDGQCQLAISDLEACQASVSEVKVARPLLRCLVGQQSWSEAAGFLAALPASVRNNSKIRKLERQVNAGDSQARAALPPESAPVVDEQASDLAPPTSAPTDASKLPVEQETPASETLPPPPDPCDPFRTAARAGRCDVAVTEMATCLGAAAERDIAPAVMKCHTDSNRWKEALAFAELLPPDARGLSRVRKLERRATKQLAKQARAQGPGLPADGNDPETDTVAAAGTPNRDGSAGVAQDPTPAQDSTPGSALSPADVAPPSAAALANARRILATASTSADITRAYAVTSRLAMDHPDHPESQLLAAQGAYRAAQWDKAVAFFSAAGGPGTDQPLLQFYNAIALFETGQPREAADLLALALPKIRRTPFVDSYVARINAAAGRNQPRP